MRRVFPYRSKVTHTAILADDMVGCVIQLNGIVVNIVNSSFRVNNATGRVYSELLLINQFEDALRERYPNLLND